MPPLSDVTMGAHVAGDLRDKRRQGGLVALAVIICTAAWASPAHAETEDPGASATAIDVARDAQASGLDLGDLERRAELQAEVDSVLDPLIEKYESSYSSAGFTDDGTAYIAFVGDVPDEVMAVLADHPHIDARGGAALSETAASELNKTVAHAVADVLPAESELVTVIEPQTGSVDIAVAHGHTESRVEEVAVEAYQDAAPRRLRARANDAVDVQVDTSLENVDEAVNGGDAMSTRGSTSLRCTAAFPATNGSLAGILTAKHCADNLTIGGGDKLFNASIFTSNSRGDAQWHRSKVGVNARFRYDTGKFRPVSAHPVLKVGTRVCRYGAATGQGSRCDEVKYVSACTKYPNLTYTICDLAMTEGWTGSAAGDSGGPWYYGNNAYGIHSGTNVRDGVSRNWFTSSRKALSAMGLTAITS